jgi:hypothetical protein
VCRQNLTCVPVCVVQVSAFMNRVVFFFLPIPLQRAFQEPGFARPACDAASARLLLCVAVLRMRLTPEAGQSLESRKGLGCRGLRSRGENT